MEDRVSAAFKPQFVKKKSAFLSLRGGGFATTWQSRSVLGALGYREIASSQSLLATTKPGLLHLLPVEKPNQAFGAARHLLIVRHHHEGGALGAVQAQKQVHDLIAHY